MFYEFFIFVGIKRLILKINSATAVLVDKNNATGEGLIIYTTSQMNVGIIYLRALMLYFKKT